MIKPLIDDCFLHDRDRLRHDEAVAILKARVTAVAGMSPRPLSECLGRTIAEPILATHPVPAHTNAAVDGYAFRHVDYDAAAGAQFPLAGRAAAGQQAIRTPAPCTTVRIFTGAVIPHGFDTVVMQEDVEVVPGADRIIIPAGLKKGANVRRAGEDIQAGAEVFTPGNIIRPQDLAALASIGAPSVTCYEQLRVAVVSTGDEVIRPGEAELGHGEVFDANAPMLKALCSLAGTQVTDLGIWPDQAGAIKNSLAKAAHKFDVILTSGGASRGEEDYMLEAIDKLGKRHMWQLAIKPGRPLMFGQIGSTPIVGLPGNPVAVFVCFLMYVYPMLRRMGGAAWPEPKRTPLPAAFTVKNRKLGRREFWRGTRKLTPQGPVVEKFARDGSGLISGLRAADGLIEVGEDIPDIEPGDVVQFIPFSEFGIVGGS